MNQQASYLHALGGHAKDLLDLAKFKIINPHSWSKFRQLKAVAGRTGADCLVETGTYLGNTAMRCSRAFRRVYTIELDEKLYEHARRYLSSRENVTCIQGDATIELPKVLCAPDCNNAVLFLDGHFSNNETAHGDVPEPACELLASLADHRDKIKGIVVDDFRLFGVESGWPRKSELLRAAEDHFPGYRLAVHLDQLTIEKLS